MTERIVSLVPSTTKSLVQLGYRHMIVGATSYCIDPPNLHREAAVVGGTKDPDVEKIAKLKPTILFANYEENTKTTIEQIEKHLPQTNIVLGLPTDILETSNEILSITSRLGQTDKSQVFLQDWQDAFKGLKKRDKKLQPAAYFIWRDPYFVAGPDTYISSVLNLAGFKNVIKEERYPEADLSKIPTDCNLFFTTEPYSFKKRHLYELWSSVPRLKNCNFYIADGRDFTWHGSHALETLKKIRQAQDGAPHDLFTKIIFS